MAHAFDPRSRPDLLTIAAFPPAAAAIHQLHCLGKAEARMCV